MSSHGPCSHNPSGSGPAVGHSKSSLWTGRLGLAFVFRLLASFLCIFNFSWESNSSLPTLRE